MDKQVYLDLKRGDKVIAVEWDEENDCQLPGGQGYEATVTGTEGNITIEYDEPVNGRHSDIFYAATGARYFDNEEISWRLERAVNGWVSARGGKWHRSTHARPVCYRAETAACGMTFRAMSIRWDGERPTTAEAHMCQRTGCKD